MKILPLKVTLYTKELRYFADLHRVKPRLCGNRTSPQGDEPLLLFRSGTLFFVLSHDWGCLRLLLLSPYPREGISDILVRGLIISVLTVGVTLLNFCERAPGQEIAQSAQLLSAILDRYGTEVNLLGGCLPTSKRQPPKAGFKSPTRLGYHSNPASNNQTQKLNTFFEYQYSI